MAEHAQQRKYRQEFIAKFEKTQALTRHTVITEAEVNGNEAVFLVAGSGDASAVTRGLNGDIPTRPEDLNQFTATLQEWHDIPERSRFNIYTSQGNGAAMMQRTSLGVLNRKIDSDIRSALTLATQTATMTQTNTATFLASCLDLVVTLSENHANDEEPFALITPAFRANLQTLPQFTSMDYVKLQAFENISKSKAFNWNGVNWIVDPALDGVGTASSTCFIYNRNAVGHACDMERIVTQIGYDDKNDKSWARASAFLGTKILQTSGIIKITHNDTAIIGA